MHCDEEADYILTPARLKALSMADVREGRGSAYALEHGVHSPLHMRPAVHSVRGVLHGT